MGRVTTDQALAALTDAQIRAGIEEIDRIHYSERPLRGYEEKVHLFRCAVARAAVSASNSKSGEVARG